MAFGVVGVLLGLVVGLRLADRSDSDPHDAARELNASLVSAAGSLEIAAVEYEESVEHGGVVRQAEYGGALDAFESSRARYREVRPAISSVFASRVEPIDELYREIGTMMRSKRDAADVVPALEDLQTLLKE